MMLSASQIKGRIKNIAKENNADARTLIRIFMMEKFLERVSVSKYKNNFIIKGGFLVTSLVGLSNRSTMDIDASFRNFSLSEEETEKFVNEIISADMGDGIDFRLKSIEAIMDEMEYPGIRVSIDAVFENLITPFKLDISTGDAITPASTEYKYKLMLEDRYIELQTYNTETVIAEKLQTVLSRGIANTRMRDFYDLHVLNMKIGQDINTECLKMAFEATCKKRNTLFDRNDTDIISEEISSDPGLKKLWGSYQKKYEYAKDIQYETVINDILKLIKQVQ